MKSMPMWRSGDPTLYDAAIQMDVDPQFDRLTLAGVVLVLACVWVSFLSLLGLVLFIRCQVLSALPHLTTHVILALLP